jgi:hypothetical protein
MADKVLPQRVSVRREDCPVSGWPEWEATFPSSGMGNEGRKEPELPEASY